MWPDFCEEGHTVRLSGRLYSKDFKNSSEIIRKTFELRTQKNQECVATLTNAGLLPVTTIKFVETLLDRINVYVKSAFIEKTESATILTSARLWHARAVPIPRGHFSASLTFAVQ